MGDADGASPSGSPPSPRSSQALAAGISKTSLERAAITRVKLERFYEDLRNDTEERDRRYVVLSFVAPASLIYPRRRADYDQQMTEATTEVRRKKTLVDLERRESDFLRLKRVRLSPDNFTTLKLIGKGAFGEVRRLRHFSSSLPCFSFIRFPC